MKFTNKKLQELATNELIYPRKYAYYSKLELQTLKENNIPHRKSEKDTADYPCDDLVSQELYWDVCELVNELAEELLAERQKRKKFIDSLKQDIRGHLNSLNDKYFEEL